MTTRWASTWDWTTPNGYLISQIDFVAEVEEEGGWLTVHHVEIDAHNVSTAKRDSIEMPYFMRPYFDVWFQSDETQKDAREAIRDDDSSYSNFEESREEGFVR